YARALRGADLACRLLPDHAIYRSRRGAARYRNGKYREAQMDFETAEQLRRNQSLADGVNLQDMAFQAMAHFQLQQIEPPLGVLARLGEEMKSSWFRGFEDRQSLLREAEALIEGGDKKAAE